MANPSKWKLRIFAAGMVVLLAATAAMGSGCSGDEGVDSVECESTRQYFALNVWQVVSNKCFACHNNQGIAKDTSYILKGASEPGFIDHNLNVIREVASFEQDGSSQWLLKPTQAIPHDGGEVIKKGSAEYKAMLGLVVRLKNPDQCEPKVGGDFTGVEMANLEATVRKAAIILAKRLPTAEEVQRVRDGGESEFLAVLDEMMTEPAFIDFVKTTYGDIFQTDFYLNNDAVGLIDDEGSPYPNPTWFETETGEPSDSAKSFMQQYNIPGAGSLRNLNQIHLAREALELVAHVVKNDLPFTEILSANYTMVSPLTQKTFGATLLEEFPNDYDPNVFVPAQYPQYTDGQGQIQDFPHAGVITGPAFLARWPTTATNRNRARSRVFMLFFLGLDILKTAEQPVDQSTVTALNPQRDDPQCAVCHTVVDPIAGVFQGFHIFGDDDAQTVVWQPDSQWYSEMWPPGFNGYDLPLEEASYGLPWMANLAVQDDRFLLGAVYNAYRGLTGREPLVAPEDFEDPNYQPMFQSFLAQANVFRTVANNFKESEFNFKQVIKDLVMSPYFRGINAVKMSESKQVALGEVGLGRLLTPKQLHAKLLAVLGLSWGGLNDPYLSNPAGDITETGEFQLFYGGVDFTDVTVRITEPNGIMAAVAERMAIQMSCEAVPRDFLRDPLDRKLFNTLTIDGIEYDPLTLAPESGGLAVPQAEEGIKRTIQFLHEHVLAEKLELDDDELNRTYQLFLETWREGINGLSSDDGSYNSNLPGSCQVYTDEFGQDLPEGSEIAVDDQYIMRSWMTVLTYMLSDYRFLYE